MNRRSWLACCAGLTLTLALAGCNPDAPHFNSVDVTGADFGKDFHLTDPDGNPRSLADFRGKVVMLFFGFTQCPDVCPTTLARAVRIRKLLGSEGDRLQVLFVTVDPERDTPEILREYTHAFDPSFIGLYGDAAATKKAADEFRVFYRKVPTGSSYTMDHTAMSYVIDPQGRLRLAVRHEERAQDVAEDIRTLLKTSS